MASVPLVIALLLTLTVGGWLALTWKGGTARGSLVSIALTADCDLQAAVLARAEGVGFGQPQVSYAEGVTRLEGRMPGLADDATAMPALLSKPGRLRVLPADSAEGPPTGAEVATEVDLVNAWLQIGLSGHPYVQLEFQPNVLSRIEEVDASSWLFELDGEIVDHFDAHRDPDDDDLRLQPRLEATRDELRLATDWSIVLQNPLPCAVRNVAVTEEGG